MSMVVFPFKGEDPEVAAANVETAARHPRVSRVLAVGAEIDSTYEALRRVQANIPVEAMIQDRIGDRRPGKGDGMNTAMRRFLETSEERLHFYDADITNFDASWIDGAEEAADLGYPIVRHYFPRASTDAMITWMITRAVFAITHPHSILWQIRQPLGGELLLTRPVVEELVGDPRVQRRSDWGIDTVITYATVASGEPIYENYVPSGKQHALYGSLGDIRAMVVECFEAAADLARESSPAAGRHEIESPAPAPDAIAHKVGYDVQATLDLLTRGWTVPEVAAAGSLPEPIARSLLANLSGPSFAFFDAGTWFDTLLSLLDHYRPEPGWQAVLFRLWTARVLAYTTRDALTGHARAMEILEGTISGYARRAAAQSGD